MHLSDICGTFLASKLSAGGPISHLLEKQFDTSIPTFSLREDVFPNAYYFAKNQLDELSLYYLKVPMHGDFHGDNLFLCAQDGKYTAIDWALASNDGLLFFDDAYFEVSTLLCTTSNLSLSAWTDTIKTIARGDWAQLTIKVGKIIEDIHRAEEQWIDEVNGTDFSHVDKMKCARSLSRVLAGLNFAGKKKVDESFREKAFIFSCIFLKKLFTQLNYTQWYETETKRWGLLPDIQQSESDLESARRLAADCAQFNGQQYRYILLCGGSLVSSSDITEYLTRIPWAGVITLSRKMNEPFYMNINRAKLLRNLLLDQKNADWTNNIYHGATWWMFANGIDNDPDTLFDSYGQWRNKNAHFLEESISKICRATSPQDLKLIIDFNSFGTEDERKKLQKILEYFDLNESVIIEAAVLTNGNSGGLNTEELENIRITEYPANMNHLAVYAANYLGAVRTNGIWLPRIDKKLGEQLSEQDEKFVNAYIEIVGDHLLNKNISPEVKRSLYRGETVSWDAIDEGIPINRPELDIYKEIVKNALQNEKWGCINLAHTPGAGATVLCRSILWQMRNDYPALRIIQLGSDAYEALKRVSTFTGLPLLILVDGDYTYGDVEALESFLRSALIKFVILYTYRRYSSAGGIPSGRIRGSDKYLSILDNKTAESFESRYRDEIEHAGKYFDDELATRKNNLRSLTTDQMLLEFRLPFFYGMYAFEEDFVSVRSYTDRIIERMNTDSDFCKAVSYIALVSYCTASTGLSGKIVKKILKQMGKSTNQVLTFLNSGLPNFVYMTNNAFRICHPVIAHIVLLNQYGVQQEGRSSLSCSKFVSLCKSFIQDIREIDGGDEPSEYANTLISNIFITRGVTDADDNLKDIAKENFSIIILEIAQFGLQKEIFSCLVRYFPNNPHCFQHYGRLLIYNMPSELVPAREQFNRAVELDEENPLHFHARGNMYRRHCKDLLETKYKKLDITPQEVYNGCKEIVNLALQDFEKAVQLATHNERRYLSYSSFNWPTHIVPS